VEVVILRVQVGAGLLVVVSRGAARTVREVEVWGIPSRMHLALIRCSLFVGGHIGTIELVKRTRCRECFLGGGMEEKKGKKAKAIQGILLKAGRKGRRKKEEKEQVGANRWTDTTEDRRHPRDQW